MKGFAWERRKRKEKTNGRVEWEEERGETENGGRGWKRVENCRLSVMSVINFQNIQN